MVGYIVSFIAALAATLALTPVARLLALHWGIVDNPDGRRKLQQQPVALLGGVAVFGGWWLGLAIMAGFGLTLRLPAGTPRAVLTLAALSLVGVFDDAYDLRVRWKLLGQILAALPIALSVSALGTVALGGWTIDLGVLGPAITLAWLVLGINALNLLDGMDGMASITGLSISLTIAALDIYCGDGHVAMFALGLGGALAGFLVFNLPPAKIYLGDAGSMVIGLAIALASMRVARSNSGVTHLTPMIALMALPLADTALAIARRSLSGRGIWHPDRGHVHHRLLDRGLSVRKVLALVAGCSVVWGAVVVAGERQSAEAFIWLTAAGLALAAVRWRLAGHHEWLLLANFMRRGLQPSAGLPTPAELESLSFAESWQRLQMAVERAQADRLTLAIERFDGSRYEHIWSAASHATPPQSAVGVEIVLRASEGATCHLRVETSGREAARHLPKMLSALERFGEFWASHPEAVPVALLRLQGAIEAAGARLPAAEWREQRRAA